VVYSGNSIINRHTRTQIRLSTQIAVHTAKDIKQNSLYIKSFFVITNWCCDAAGCSTKSEEGCSRFIQISSLRVKWTGAIKQQQIGQKGPTTASLLCSKHFEPNCFITEEVRYRDSIGILTKN